MTHIQGGGGGGGRTATRGADGSTAGHITNGMIVDEDMNMACANNSRGDGATK